MLLPVQKLNYRYPITTVFPETVPSVPGTETITPAFEDLSVKDGLLHNLIVIEYRYNRFAVDPRTGLFAMVRFVVLIHTNSLRLHFMFRDWRDSRWTSVSAVQSGVDEPTIKQRLILFTKNEIDIEGKSTVSLLVEEVSIISMAAPFLTILQIIHPFYVFQIASIILWSLDDYYYYAFCIALISIISITTTLIETKKVKTFCIRNPKTDDVSQTISRMREMSRLFCRVDVFRDGFCNM